MEKGTSKNRNIVLKAVDQESPKSKEIFDPMMNDKKFSEFKNTIKNIDWNYETLFEDLSGFIEGHEKSAIKLKEVETEKARIQSELTSSERKIEFLNKKLKEGRSELDYLKRGYQSRVDELVAVRTDLQAKFEAISEKKRQTEFKYKELYDTFKRKDEELGQNKRQLGQLNQQLVKLNGSFGDKLKKFKDQYNEKLETKEKLLTAKANRIAAEKDQLQNYINELMADSNKTTDELNSYKHQVEELKLQKANLANVKETLANTIEKKEKDISMFQAKLSQMDKGNATLAISYRKKTEEISDLQNIVTSLKSQNEDFVAKETRLAGEIENLNQKISARDQQIEKLNNEILSFKEKQLAYNQIVEKVKALEGAEEKLKVQIAEQKKQMAQMNANSETFKVEIADHKKEISALKIKEKALIEKHSASEASFEARLTEITNQKTELQERVVNIIRELEEAKTNLKNTSDSLAQEQKTTSILSEKIKQEESKFQEVNGTMQAMALAKEAATSELGETKRVLADLKQKLMKKVFEVNELQAVSLKNQNSASQLSDDRKTLEMQVADLTNDLAISEKRKNELMEDIAEFNKQMNLVSGQILDLKDEKANLENQIKSLQTELNHEKEQTEEIKSNFQEASDELMNLKLKETEYIENKQEWEDQKEVYESKLGDLKTSLKEKENDILLKQASIEEGIEERKSWIAKNDELMGQIKALQVDSESMKDSESRQLSRIDTLVGERKQITTKLEDADKKIIELQASVEGLNTQKKELLAKIDELENEVHKIQDNHESKVEALNAEISKQMEMNRAAQNKLDEQNIRLGELEQKEKSYLNLIEKKETQMTSEQQNIVGIRQQFEEMKSINNELSSELVKRAHEIEGLKKGLISKENELEDINFQLRTSEAKCEEIIKSNENLVQNTDKNQKISADLEKAYAEQKALKEQLAEREKKINLYSRWVDSQKEGLQKHVVLFVNEMKASGSLNPLKPYLEITEREISKMEVQMRKPNLFGPQKAQYVMQYEQLAKQRDEVKTLLAKAKEDLDARADKLIDLLKNSEFVPAPPMPPGKTKA